MGYFTHNGKTCECRGFPVEQYKQDRLGLVLAFWALGLHLGRPLISQTDYKADGTVFGSVLNHVTDGRFLKGTSDQGLLSSKVCCLFLDHGENCPFLLKLAPHCWV